MDPNAAALAQFAKSFDDLVRGFQEMLITGLRPALQFLSENTAALTASLTLFAIPILRAILPSLGDWEESTKKLEKRNRRFFNAYKTGLKDSGEELNTFIKTQKQQEKEATKRARKILKGTESSAGVDFLRGEGESGDRRKQAAARKIIETALQQTKDGKDAETGYLKGKNREQVLDVQKSYSARVAAAKAANKKTILSFDFAFKVIKGGILGVGTVWQGVMVGMARAATIAAAAINFAFKATAIIGVLTLLYEAGKALFRFFIPLTEQQKRQNAIVEELGDSYGKLSEQMQGARKARESLLAGADRQINVGNILASSDVDNVISGINKITELDTDSDAYENLKKDLLSVVRELGRIDPKFKELNKNLSEGKTVSAEQGKAIKSLANDYIDLGVRLANVPTLIKEANDAFASLSASINNTPLSNLVDRTDKALDGLDLRVESSNKTLRAFLKEQQDAVKTAAEIAKIQATATTLFSKGFLNVYTDANLERLEELMASDEFRTDEQLSAILKSIEATIDLIEADEDLRKAQQRRFDFANKKEQEILRLRQGSLKISIEDAKRRSRGESVYAKTINLEEERNKSRQKLVGAQEKLIAAEVAMFELEGDKLQTALENRTAMELNLELVRAEVDFEQRVLDFKERQLATEMRMLAVSMRQQALDKASGALRRDLDFSKATGAGTEEALKRQRTLQRQLLENAVQNAKDEVLKAEAARKDVQDQIRRDVERKVTARDILDPSGTRILTEPEFSAKMDARKDTAVATSPEGQREFQARERLRQAESALEIDKNRLLTFKNQNIELVEQAKNQLAAVGFTQAHVLFNERLLEAKRQGVILTDIELDKLKEQTIQTVMLTEIAASKQQLFFSIGDSIAGAFTSIIDGSMSAKDAFKQMAKSILADILSMVVRLTVMRALMSFLPFPGGGSVNPSLGTTDLMFPGMNVPGAVVSRMGGVFEPKGYRMGGKVKDYSTGGIARGSDHGYPAVLHGREAVVPLPSGDKIPVELNGAGGQQNNVTVNVSVNNDGTATTNTEGNSGGMENLGRLVAKAVQDELVEQKRAGGILSPYGAM